MLKFHFRFLEEEDTAGIHPFSPGGIFAETASETVTSHGPDNRDAFFLLSGVTELLNGLFELQNSPQTKKYVFVPEHGRFDLLFERRKGAALAVKCRNRLLGVFPESEVYEAIRDAGRAFRANYRPRFPLSDGRSGASDAFAAANKDVMDEFDSALSRFESVGFAESAVKSKVR